MIFKKGKQNCIALMNDGFDYIMRHFLYKKRLCDEC